VDVSLLPDLRRRGRPRSHGRPPRRRSVLLPLIALAVVPALGLPVFAGFFAQDKLEEAKAARQIGRAMTLTAELDDLTSAIADESTSSAFRFFSTLYGLSDEQLTDLLGVDLAVPIETARGRTDDAFRAVHPDTETRAALADLRAQLLDVRRSIGDGDEATTAEAGWKMYRTFADLGHTGYRIKRATIDRVVTGYYGSGSTALMTTVEQLQRVTTVVDVGYDQGVLLQGLFSATSDEDRIAVVVDLRDVKANWQRLTADLPSGLSPAVRRSWQSLIEDPEFRAFNAFIDDLVRPGSAVTTEELSPDTSSPEIREGARRAIILEAELGALVHQSTAEGLGVARADQRAAEGRARVSVGATAALLLLTATLLVLIGGSLRRQLGGLAAAAERFSAGQLDEMPVHGPREIAMASAALNDAVASFRRVAVQAERLSTGDLDAPELREAAPGGLGTLVHTSVQRIVVAVREREKLREALAHQAAHDDLTHLPNRAETERLLSKALARAQRSQARVGVLFVDLDHFKQCNDTFGHAAGDHVLRTAASRMTAVVRPGDTVCRLGGDEFVVVVEPVGDDRSVVEIAERITTALAETIRYGDETILVAGSVGVAISDQLSDADSLLREADSAMYQAKATARGSVGIFDEELRAELNREADFREAMARALEEGELELHYQPVLDVASGRVAGFEALARWQRPGFGMVGPDQFIPLAEESGLIVDIGQWALLAATTQLVAWSADPAYASLEVAVNLSGRHIAQASVVEDVRRALRDSGLEPARLVIEITESIAIDNPTTISHLSQLAALGVLIALDDFGTGYTSIGQLLHLPVHILKIDRSLVSGGSEDGTRPVDRSTRIIDLIVEVAHSLDLAVVAEGVEESSQLDKLRTAGCDSAQGYLFSRPLPVAQVPAWVTAHTTTLRDLSLVEQRN